MLDKMPKYNPSPISKLVYTLWLFTASDMKGWIPCQMLFGVLGALSGPVLTTKNTPSIWGVLLRLPNTFLWTWLNTLIFNIDNQRLTASILEDSVNKPWRPLPSQRLSPQEAQKLLLKVIPISIAIIHWGIGGTEETISLLPFYWLYNHSGWGDNNFVSRDSILGIGYMISGCGNLRIACGYPASTINAQGASWILLVGSMMFTVVHTQDFRDIEGDRARHRKTAPIVMGENFSRYLTAFILLFWSIVCCIYWEIMNLVSVTVFLLGSLIAVRLIRFRSSAADGLTWKITNLWIVLVYALPYVKYLSRSSNEQH